jgi:hypothetical protein
MAKECTHHHCSHTYHASAFGVSGEILRPAQRSIPAHAATTLAPGGGRGFNRTDNIQIDGLLSFSTAYTEVGGSFDECHQVHTSYASSVIEDLNIADVVKADRIVCRIAIYSPMEGSKEESSFDITGSHFENLRICGHHIDVELATGDFHQHDTHAKFEQAYQRGDVDHLFFISGLKKAGEKKLAELKDNYHALHGFAERVTRWNGTPKTKAQKAEAQDGTIRSYSCSAAGHLDLKQHVGAKSELEGYGPIICIPKFGIVRLAEVTVHQHRRSLNMLRVDMCSVGEGTIHTGGSGGGAGGSTFP